MPLPSPDPVEPAPTTLDTAAYALLPVPVAWCDALGRGLGCNDAFTRFTGWRARPDRPARLPGDVLGAGPRAVQAPAADGTGHGQRLLALLQAGADADDLPWCGLGAQDAPLAGRLSIRCHAGLRVLTLLPRDEPAPRADPGAAAGPARADAQALLLRPNGAQPGASFGCWSCDLRSGERRWDAQVWRFWGHPHRPGALDLAATMATIHPEDRDEAIASQERSYRRTGHYSHRYRLLRPQGDEVRVRTLWHVSGDADGRPAHVSGIVIDDTENHRLAQSASDAQAQLNLVLALADIAIWEHDQASGLLHTSTLGWALLGLPPQPQGLPLALAADRLDADSRQLLLAQLGGAGVDITTDIATNTHTPPDDTATDDAGPGDLALRCRRPDGKWRTLLTRRVRRQATAGQAAGHVGVLLDLSERFDAQQQAMALASRLEMATAAAGVGVWSVLLDTPPQAHWDAQMRKLHGLAAEAPAPTMCDYLAAHVHADDRVSVKDSLDMLVQRNDGLLDMDIRIVRPDGEVRRLATRTSVRGGAGPRQLHGVVLDVTERHATEAQLRQAMERAALAARGAGIGTWESDREADHGWWDAQMFRLRGMDRPPGLVSRAEMRQWLHPADHDGYGRQLQTALRDDLPTNGEFRVVWPDGTVRWLATRSTPVRDESGRTVRRIGINWDITDARNAEAARQERLLAQHERQAKARFLARISHELRTPLNAVLGFSQLLLAETPVDHAPDPATWRSRVSQVQTSGEHLLALIDDVLELSSLESGELPLALQPVALAPLVQTSLPLVELLARQHEVALVPGALGGWVLADPVRLRQVLLNLLSNAIKYNRRGGQVRISAEASGNWWLLRVEDTGRGLNQAQLEHLFEPFNRLGAERDGIAGTGIGLAIVQAAVQHMGGSVQVRSSPGLGSVFELALQQATAAPAAAATAAAQADAPGAETGMPLPALLPRRDGARPLLLYIEDNAVNMLIVRELVRQRPDLDFEGAVDGGSGLALARSLQPALILLDMQLPDMDGHAVLRALRADPATAAMRCIAVSANAMPEDIRIARAEGFDDYWTKPLDLSAFLRGLAQLFGPPPSAPA